jgi:phenylalanyl-tRNA synthetase alpha chain
VDLSLSVAEKRLLRALADGKPHAAAETAAKAGFASEGEALQAAGGPQRHGLLDVVEDAKVLHVLTGEGKRIQTLGLPEERARAKLAGPTSVPALAAAAGLSDGEARVLVGLLKKNGWAEVSKGAAGPELRPVGDPSADYPLGKTFRSLSPEGRDLPASPELSQLVERGLAAPLKLTRRTLQLTPAGAALAKGISAEDLTGAADVNQVTPDLVARWGTMSAAERAKTTLRPFDFNVPVTVPSPGKAHPLTHIIQEIREIFVALGFSEIAGDYVEPAFWNMDALFIPQDHPARDMQDTFYLKSPATAPIPDGMFAKVRDVHQKGGGTGSLGWGGGFERATAERTLLRTHTTVTTIRHLAAHPQPPLRVFGIGRVFRNEAMDATHLPEFHQVEGIVAEEGANLSMLMGVLREFYKRMGFPDIKFRPSFYPYTEPSLDVAVKWNDKWLELGGAGVFRPEVTKPLGVQTNVLAWGLGLERLAMLRLGLKDIRQLYLSDVDWLRTTPVR